MVEHIAMRPTWDCAACGKPWPCDPAREYLAGSLSRTTLSINLTVALGEAARDLIGAATPAQLYERFLAWTW